MARFVFPKFRGAGRLYRILSKIEDVFGIRHIDKIKMRLGHVMTLDRRSGTEFSAFYTGSYEDRWIDILSEMVDEQSCFLDIGANIGFYSIAIANSAKRNSIKVLAFEPVPSNFERLKLNCELNDLNKTMQLFQVGLSNQKGLAEITLREDFVNGGSTGNAAIVIEDHRDEHFEKIRINLVSLDALAEEHKLGPVSAMKVDIEGHEDMFLEGARTTIIRDKPLILMEVNNHYYRRKQASLDSACCFLDLAGYGKYLVSGKRANKITNLDVIDALENVWLVPPGRRDKFLTLIQTR